MSPGRGALRTLANPSTVGIIILDESVASKIAAGEVIERPASVVKELTENALDAGARHIEVEVREAGRGLIRVTDDGSGMTREDAVLSLQRHATSKLRAADDLFNITTLGFRGEALPSIASVSHLTLITRTADSDSATRLVVVGGEVTELEEVGAPVGTQVSISKLFYNTPARLKFLRRDAAESAQIEDTVTRFLFSHHATAFRLRLEGRDLLQHPGSPDLRGAVVAAWGHELAEALLPVGAQGAGLSATGLISSPSLHRAGRSQQFIFVNHRWVRNRMLTHGLEEAYRGLIPEKRFPVAVLLVEVDPQAVDVNVHPTKAEVRLSREQEVHHLVINAARTALAGETAAPGLASPTAGASSGLVPTATSSAQPRDFGEGWAGTIAAPSVFSPAFQAAGGNLQLRPLAQLRDTYILAESRAGLLLVDQHRAQERILYERFTEARLSQRPPSQALLSPASVQMRAQEAAAITEQLEELKALGFEVEPFGSDAFLVRAVPAEFKNSTALELLHDLAEELCADSANRSLERRREKLLITLSCRSAVKAGDRLSYEEMTELLRDLAATARPYTCPHGWPIVMTISHFEIDRKFNR